MNEEICRELLELVLGFRIAKVTVSREKSYVYHPKYKGVRLDIIAADEKIPIMMWKCRSHAKRSRGQGAGITIVRSTWISCSPGRTMRHCRMRM